MGSDDECSMLAADIATSIGYLIGAFSIGYCGGLGLLVLKKALNIVF